MLFSAAAEAEETMRFAEAAKLYGELLRLAPSDPRAPRARARLEDLRAHAEGDFAPLTRLEELRRDPKMAADPRAIEALERDADSFPKGRVRAEARLLSGTAWLGRLGDPSRAIQPLSAVLHDVDADPLHRRLALSQLVEARRALGDLSGAVADVDAFPELLPNIRDAIHREARRVWIRRGAIALCASILVIGGAASFRIARSMRLGALARLTLRPLALVFAAWLGLGGAMLARGYDASDPSPFLFLAAAIALTDIAMRAWSAAMHHELAPRIATPFRVTLGIAAVIAAAFLALDASDPAYLESFGL